MKGTLIVCGIILAVLALGAGAFHWKFLGNDSEGTRVGTISKCSKKGTIKTHECDAFVGAANVGTNSGPAMGASVWSFTVRDDEWDAGLGATLDMAENTHQMVRLEYIQPRWCAPWKTVQSGWCYYVTGVTLLGAVPQVPVVPVLPAGS